MGAADTHPASGNTAIWHTTNFITRRRMKSRLIPEEIDHVISLIEQIADAVLKSDFLTKDEQRQLNDYTEYEKSCKDIATEERLGMLGGTRWNVIKAYERQRDRIQTPYDPDKAKLLASKRRTLRDKHVKVTVPPLQRELDLYLAPRWAGLLQCSSWGFGGGELRKAIEYYFLGIPGGYRLFPPETTLPSKKSKVIRELERIKAKLEYDMQHLVNSKAGAGQSRTSAETTQNQPQDGREKLGPKPKLDDNMSRPTRSKGQVKMGAILFNENSPLLPVTRQKLDKLRETLKRDKLTLWLWFNSRGVNLTDFYGNTISMSGGAYNDSTASVFFSFIAPFLKHAIVRTLDETLETCRTRGLKPEEPYIRETAMLLDGFLIDPIYRYMADIDRRIRGRGCPKNVGRKDVTDKITEMVKFLDKCKDEMIQGIKEQGGGKTVEKVTELKPALNQIATQVEDIFISYPKARGEFKKNVQVYARAFEKYYEAKSNEPQPYNDPTGKKKKEGFDYDKDHRTWFPVNAPQLPPNPTKWFEMKDKLPCYYTILALIHDLEKYKYANTVMPDEIKGLKHYSIMVAFMQRYLSGGYEPYTPEGLDTALKQVKADLRDNCQLKDPAEDDKPYVSCSDALKFAETKNRKISPSKLSKILVEDGPMRFEPILSKTGKPYRKNVHFGDFKEYIKTLPKIKPDGKDITDEAIDDFVGDAKDEYSVIHKEKEAKHKGSNPQIDRGITRLANRISGLDV